MSTEKRLSHPAHERHTMKQRLTALSAFAALTVLLSGCAAANGSTPASGGPAGQGQTAPAGAPHPAAPNYGDVVGTGTKVTVADGSYETIALDPKSRLYDVAVGGGLADTLAQSGFTLDDAKAAQKFALDYVVKEFIDSTALETKDDGFKAWIAANGHTYFSDEILGELAANKPGGAQLLLGDLGSMKTIPALIHDGKPREKNVTATVNGLGTFEGQGVKAIKIELTYGAQYRLTGAAAATFAGSLVKPAMTAEQFIASASAKPSLKMEGEYTYGATGSATIGVDKDSQGRWQIDGFQSQTNFDPSSFAVTAGK